MKSILMFTALTATGCALTLSACDTQDGSPAARAAYPDTDRSSSTASADNTANNRDDAERDANTPMDQSESSEHIKLTATIRQAIVADDTLSMNAKNCKIITDESGTVWLRGVVGSQAEKTRIEEIAKQKSGANIVRNELEITDG